MVQTMPGRLEPSHGLARRKIDGLEAIRGLAALVVVWGHLFLWRLLPDHPLKLPGQFATEAVIAFFVLSGAVITLSRPNDADRSIAVRKYVRARFIRIYPIFLVGLGLS